jgi:hypothetical protein
LVDTLARYKNNSTIVIASCKWLLILYSDNYLSRLCAFFQAKVLLIGGDHLADVVREDEEQTLRQMEDVTLEACLITNGMLKDIQRQVTDNQQMFEEKDVIIISAGGYDLAKLNENESSVLASMHQTVEQVCSVAPYSAILVLHLLPRAFTGTNKNADKYNKEVSVTNK